MTPLKFLNAIGDWLPGGVCTTVCITSSAAEWEHAQAKGWEEAGVREWKGVDFRTGGRTLQSFEALEPYRAAPLTKAAILTHEDQYSNLDIVTSGPLGCAASHMAVWAAFVSGIWPWQIPPEDQTKQWVVVLESGVEMASGDRARKALQDLVSHPLPGAEVNGPGVVRFLWRGQPLTTIPTPHPNLCVLTGRKVWGTKAYAIARWAAPAYLAAMTPISGHIDVAMLQLAAAGVTAPMWNAHASALQLAPRSRAYKSMHAGWNVRLVLPESPVLANVFVFAPWFLLLITLALTVPLLVMRRCK